MSISDSTIAKGGFISPQSCWPGSQTYWYPQVRDVVDPVAEKVCYLAAKWASSDADDDLFSAFKRALEEWEAARFGV